MSDTNITESCIPNLDPSLKATVLAARNGDWAKALKFFENAFSQECLEREENAAREALFQAYEFAAQLQIIAIDTNMVARISDDAIEKTRTLPMKPAAEPLLFAVSKWCQQKDHAYLQMKIQRLIDTAPDSPQSLRIAADFVVFLAMALTFPIRMVEKVFSGGVQESTHTYTHAAHA